jgi:hypothetical protein
MFKCLAPFLLFAGLASAVAGVDYAKDVQPIFARHCYECHGAEKQKGKLRLDERLSALRKGDDAVIVPGKPDQSELYRRILLPKGDEDVMPNRGELLSRTETDLVRDWIAQGAVWPEGALPIKHWAYICPVKSPLPKLKNPAAAKNGIDNFVLARLEKEKLVPSPEADRYQLLRRVYLDLIGLPPSPEETAAFLADKSPDAYEKVVDALLKSPQYGLRWARPWLDLARYADSSGYQRDNLWQIWPYRDWVVDALNRDMPFDEFTIEQIAGDLLPNPTLAQKIATGFNRCSAINVEAGSDQEESRVNQILDRVNTLGTVWLGSTIECTQCHNHKYDPFTQKDYYQLFAFFNNTPKETKFAKAGNTAALEFSGPYLSVPDPAVEARRAAIQQSITEVEKSETAAREKLLTGEQAWEKQTLASLPTLPRAHVLEISDFETESDSFHQILNDQSVLIRNNENAAAPAKDTYTVTVHTKLAGITAFKVEALSDPSLPGGGPGRGDEKRPNFILTELKVTAKPEGNGPAKPVKLRRSRVSFEQKNFTADKALDGNPKTGWGISPHFSQDHFAVFETGAPLQEGEAATLVFVLKQDFGGGRMIGRLRLSALTGAEGTNDLPEEVVTVLTLLVSERSAAQTEKLHEFFLSSQPEINALKSRKLKLSDDLKKVMPSQTLVMQEMESKRASTIFVRGNFLTKGEAVTPGVPAVLPPLTEEPRNRLALARWLVSTNNPLVARVTVNRWWTEFFGHGLVTTPEDFGVKGDPPTHPELLDWLACEFMESGWSMKHMHRLMVTSATYCQSSAIRPDLRERDDQNKLYARGPRVRMDAEMIRDNALAISGLLSLKMGGPPVHPYQPPGIWGNKVGGAPVTYEISEGEDRYRRGIYTVWKRTSPYPAFITFDAPSRITCIARRPRSNTPLQALTLLNDPVYVEAAKSLAARVLKEMPSANVEDRIKHAFQLCLVRPPAAAELKTLVQLYQDQLEASRKEPDAKKLLPESAGSEKLDSAEFAAWYSVVSALLNLDETITKG